MIGYSAGVTFALCFDMDYLILNLPLLSLSSGDSAVWWFWTSTGLKYCGHGSRTNSA